MSEPNIRLRKVPEFIASFLSWAGLAGRELNKSPLIPLVSYRGHADGDNWKLLPSLCRERTNMPVELLRQDEVDVVAEFRSRFDFRDWTDMEVMADAQHHGAPTRLLDWTRNPFVGLWFAVANADYDKCAGAVFQLSLLKHSSVVTAMTESPIKFVAGGDFESQGKHPIHVFSSPPRVERTERQGSVFSFASFNGGYATKPLEEVLVTDESQPVRKFSVPSELKSELRRLLSDLGLDAWSLYGGPDALGKSITSRLWKSKIAPVIATRT
ncbi:MAG: FRG domain-containing protein [Verrucomicrobiae bacterium]|nr:FRG domain-containing protein [Verrucomicrobiae bacterium]